MNEQQASRYSRHILLQQLGAEGQEKILKSSILVIGCGGLGSVAIPFLASAGVGHLTIADDDYVDVSNLQRQTHYLEKDIGESKAKLMASYIALQNKDVKVTTLTRRLALADLIALCKEHDAVLDCSDNFVTRRAINQASVITKTPLIFGSAIRFEGQLSVFNPQDQKSPCYACIFDGDDMKKETCATFGVFAPLVGIIGAKQAVEALKLVAGIGKLAVGQLENYDALTLESYPVTVKRNPNCKVCH